MQEREEEFRERFYWDFRESLNEKSFFALQSPRNGTESNQFSEKQREREKKKIKGGLNASLSLLQKK